jgi:hypothetical protein
MGTETMGVKETSRKEMAWGRNYGCEGNLKGRMAWGQKLWV